MLQELRECVLNFQKSNIENIEDYVSTQIVLPERSYLTQIAQIGGTRAYVRRSFDVQMRLRCSADEFMTMFYSVHGKTYLDIPLLYEIYYDKESGREKLNLYLDWSF